MESNIKIKDMYAREENGQIKKYSKLPEYYKHWAGTFQLQSDEVHKQEGFFPVVIPEWDNDLQKRGSEILWDETNQQYYYEVIDKTEAELEEEEQRRLYILDSQFDQQAAKRLLRKITEPILADETNLTEQDIEDAKMLYKQYRVGVEYDKDSTDIDKKRFVWNNDLYKVIGASHISQSDWTPDTAVSLYTKIVPPGQIVAWNVDDSDSYELGTRVTHNNKTWECINATYAWIEPGSQDGHYGWVEI